MRVADKEVSLISRKERSQRGRRGDQRENATQRTRSEEEPKEPHRQGGKIVVRRPRVVPDRDLRARRPVLREPKLAQPPVEPGVLAQLPLVLPVVLQHHQVSRPEHLVQRPHPFLRQPSPRTAPTREGSKRTDRTPNPRLQPLQLHAPPPQLRSELRRTRRPTCTCTGARRARARVRAESPHERGGVEFGGEDARVEVRVRRAREGRVQASVDEQERDQLMRWTERVARDGEQRDLLEELVRDRVQCVAHFFFCFFVFFVSTFVEFLRWQWMVVLRQNDDAHGDHRNSTTTNINTERTRLGICHIKSIISTSDFDLVLASDSSPFSFGSATLAIHDVIFCGREDEWW